VTIGSGEHARRVSAVEALRSPAMTEARFAELQAGFYLAQPGAGAGGSAGAPQASETAPVPRRLQFYQPSQRELLAAPPAPNSFASFVETARAAPSSEQSASSAAATQPFSISFGSAPALQAPSPSSFLGGFAEPVSAAAASVGSAPDGSVTALSDAQAAPSSAAWDSSLVLSLDGATFDSEQLPDAVAPPAASESRMLRVSKALKGRSRYKR
jgi:hypothetical protein